MAFAGFIDAQFTIPSGVTISVTTNSGGPTSVTITAGSYYAYSFPSTLASILTAARPVTGGAWSVSLDATTGKYTIAVTAGTYSITWTSTTFRDLIGYNATITTQTSVTAAAVARGFFAPDHPVAVDGDLYYAHRPTDQRQSESPGGFVLGLVGNSKYRYRNVRYSHVDRARVFGYSSSGQTASGGTWQQFLYDAHLGLGHLYFTPSSRVRIRWGSTPATDILGATDPGTSTGWFMKGINEFAPRKVGEQWTGLWTIEIPELVTDGS